MTARELSMSPFDVALTRERFLRHAEHGEIADCWKWLGSRDLAGYGAFFYRGQLYRAHRVSYLLFVGDLDSHRHIHHRCNNKACVNPTHLQQVTPKAHVSIHAGERGR